MTHASSCLPHVNLFSILFPISLEIHNIPSAMDVNPLHLVASSAGRNDNISNNSLFLHYPQANSNVHPLHTTWLRGSNGTFHNDFSRIRFPIRIHVF
jgi:hypothetical protein